MSRQKKIIWGVGKDSNNPVRNYILQHYYDDILYFVDSDIEKNGTKINGIPIYLPDKIQEDKFEDIEIIISLLDAKMVSEVIEQLKRYQLSENVKITVGRDKFGWAAVSENYFKRHKDVTPENLCIELSSFCNLKCKFCFFHGYLNANKSKESFMTWEILKEIARQAKRWENLKILTCFHSGEEFLNPQWAEMLSYFLEETKIPKLIFSTNGMLLDKNNCDKFLSLPCDDVTLQISFSGRTIEECEEIRKGIDYQKVKNNIILAQSILKDKVKIRFNIDYIVSKTDIERAGYIASNIKYTVPEYIKDDFENIQFFVGPTVFYNEYRGGYRNYKMQIWSLRMSESI